MIHWPALQSASQLISQLNPIRNVYFFGVRGLLYSNAIYSYVCHKSASNVYVDLFVCLLDLHAASAQISSCPWIIQQLALRIRPHVPSSSAMCNTIHSHVCVCKTMAYNLQLSYSWQMLHEIDYATPSRPHAVTLLRPHLTLLLSRRPPLCHWFLAQLPRLPNPFYVHIM